MNNIIEKLKEDIEKVRDFFPEMKYYDAKGLDVDEISISGEKGKEYYCISFRLDMDDSIRFNYKLLSYLSYLTADNHYSRDSKISLYYHERINCYFRTEFTLDDLQRIYCRIGTGCNPKLGYKFIENNFDLKVLG